MNNSEKSQQSQQLVTPSRRNLLKGLGLGVTALGMSAAVPLMADTALAQSSPTVARQAAIYRFMVGDINVTIINDGVVNFPPPMFGINAPDGEIATLLERHHLPTDNAVVPLHCMLIDTGTHLALIDTGMGFYAFPGDTRNSGKLLSTLTMLDIRPEDIDTVILSHGHPDHLGGVIQPHALETIRPARLTFPNARYILPEAEWDFWTARTSDPDDAFMDFMLKVANASLQPLSNRIELMSTDFIAANREIIPGISAVAAPGHTVGHTAFHIESNGEELPVPISSSQSSRFIDIRPDIRPVVLTSCPYASGRVSPGCQGDYSARIDIFEPGENVQLYQKGFALNSKTYYRLEFTARSNTGHDLSVYVHKHGVPYTNYGLRNFRVNVTEEWNTFDVTFRTKNINSSTQDSRLRL